MSITAACTKTWLYKETLLTLAIVLFTISYKILRAENVKEIRFTLMTHISNHYDILYISFVLTKMLESYSFGWLVRTGVFWLFLEVHPLPFVSSRGRSLGWHGCLTFLVVIHFEVRLQGILFYVVFPTAGTTEWLVRETTGKQEKQT